jgi:hypothetical protein
MDFVLKKIDCIYFLLYDNTTLLLHKRKIDNKSVAMFILSSAFEGFKPESSFPEGKLPFQNIVFLIFLKLPRMHSGKAALSIYINIMTWNIIPTYTLLVARFTNNLAISLPPIND